jgi:hypothetical protein
MKKMRPFQKGISSMFKIIGLIVIIALLVPIGYFAWRASQPMSMPEFGGLSYYELLSERRLAYNNLAKKYQASHPSIEVNHNACFITEILTEVIEIPMSGYYALSEMYPVMQKTIDPQDIRNGYLPANVTWENLLPSAWKVYEKFVWGSIEHIPEGPVPYCRISAS